MLGVCGSPLSGPSVCVEAWKGGVCGGPNLTQECGQAAATKRRRIVETIHVHKAVADTVPFFAVQYKRWRDDAQQSLKVDLPEGVGVDALKLVLEKAYFPEKSLCGLNMHLALQAAQLASMLNCTDAILDAFVLAVRDAAATQRDIEALTDFCEAHQVPEELMKLSKRLCRQDDDQFTHQALRTMLFNSLKHNDSDMLRVATRLLKQRSRRGGVSLDEVAAILAKDSRETSESTETLFQLASEFVQTHPQYYRKVVEALFNERAPLVDLYISNSTFFKQQKIAMAAKYFDKLLHIGLHHLKLPDRMDSGPHFQAADVVALIKRAAQHDTYISGITLLVQPDCLSTLGAALPEMGSRLQLEACEVFTSLEDGRFSALVRSDMLANLAIEAKSVFTNRMLALSDGQLGRVVTDGVVEHLARSVKIRLCQKAYLFRPDVKATLLRLLEPDAVDSGDGF